MKRITMLEPVNPHKLRGRPEIRIPPDEHSVFPDRGGLGKGIGSVSIRRRTSPACSGVRSSGRRMLAAIRHRAMISFPC